MATVERAIPVGGASLNFKVVGGTTRPANPKENTIWVNTDLEISGWAFDAEIPNYLATGGVWFKIGSASSASFNAMKKNAIVLYPQTCMQWNGSTFVTREALVYKNGEWLAMRVWLLCGSNQYTQITGGWTIIDQPNNAHSVATIDSNGLTFATTEYIGKEIATVSPVDFTGIDTLYFSVPCIANSSGNQRCMSLGINKTRTHTWSATNAQSWAVEKHIVNPANATNQLYALDTSGVNGDYYVLAVTGCVGGTTLTVVINEIYGV